MNENIQILTTYNPFVITGIVLSCLWAGAYILSWLVQWAWAWVDESKADSNNRVVQFFERSHVDGWHKTTDSFYHRHYYKFINFKDGSAAEKTSLEFSVRDENGDRIDCDFLPKTNYDGDPEFKRYIFILPLIWFGMLCLNFWYVSMWFAMAYATAFTMRMARRGQKILTKHINDKDAHKETSLD